jgi:NOL1/NOP2/fmu family ribosome biogenesis protein
MVREGVAALKAGKKDEARTLLMKAVEIDQHHEEAWLYLSGVVETEEDQQTCLENVLAINPANERARKGLQYLEQKRTGVVPAPPPPRPAAPPPPAASKRAADMSTSVEWAAPADESSAPAPVRKGMELSDEDYDQWVTGLNLPAGTKSPFGEDDADEFDEPDEDAFMPRTAPPAAAAPITPEKAAAKEFTPVNGDADEIDDLRPAPAKAMTEKPPRQKPQPKVKPEPVPPPEPLFPEIPDEVRATRLPGTNERVPLLLIALVILLVVGNIVAAVLLVQAILPAA